MHRQGFFKIKIISLWSGWAKALLSLAHSGKVLGAGGGEPLSSLPLPESPPKKSVKNYYKERKLAVKSLPSPSPSSPPLLPTSSSPRALVINLGSNGISSRLASMFRLSVRTCWRKRLGGGKRNVSCIPIPNCHSAPPRSTPTPENPLPNPPKFLLVPLFKICCKFLSSSSVSSLSRRAESRTFELRSFGPCLVHFNFNSPWISGARDLTSALAAWPLSSPQRATWSVLNNSLGH